MLSLDSRGLLKEGKNIKTKKVEKKKKRIKKNQAEHFYCPLAFMFACQSKCSFGIGTAVSQETLWMWDKQCRDV